MKTAAIKYAPLDKVLRQIKPVLEDIDSEFQKKFVIGIKKIKYALRGNIKKLMEKNPSREQQILRRVHGDLMTGMSLTSQALLQQGKYPPLSFQEQSYYHPWDVKIYNAVKQMYAETTGYDYMTDKKLGSDNLRSKITKLANDNPELREHLVPILKQANQDNTFDLECGDTGVVEGTNYHISYITLYHPIENIGKRGKVVEVTSMSIKVDRVFWQNIFKKKIKNLKHYRDILKVWDSIKKEALANDPDLYVSGPYTHKVKGVDKSLPTPKAHMVKDIKGIDIIIDLNAKPIKAYFKSFEKTHSYQETYWFKIHHRYKKQLQALATEIEGAYGTKGLIKILDDNKIKYDYHTYIGAMWD